jgi:hypothetical protein
VKTDELYKKEILGLNVTTKLISAYCDKGTPATATGTAFVNLWRSRDALTLQQLAVKKNLYLVCLCLLIKLDDLTVLDLPNGDGYN